MPNEILKFEKLQEWQQAVIDAAGAKALIEREQTLRKEVAELFFPAPVEGTNAFELNAGYKLKLTYKLDRKLDEAALPAVMERVRGMQVNTDELLKFEPTLVLKSYRALMQLHPEAAKVFDEALTIKPASPTLELVAPKEK